jgi:uncharacterized protein DUF6896
METNTIQLALYALIQRFVQRQSLVFEAIKDLRPDWVMEVEHEDNSEFWADWTPETWQSFVLEHARRPATGEWGENKEWEYFLHGHGCRLTHKVTQERIEWDLGSLSTFDRSWFLNYLKSLLDQNTNDEAIATVQVWYENEKKLKPEYKQSYRPLHDAVFPVLEQLYQMGFLSQHQQYYTLVSQG